MPRLIAFLVSLLFATSVATAQVKIHDTAVSILAKPFKIAERIELESVDLIHGAPDGSKRLIFTLRSSGVKEVVLKDPEFSLDVVMPDGNWASLGTLSGCSITFPASGKTTKESRTYVANLGINHTCTDISRYLQQAAKSGSQLRMIGKAEMSVNSNGRTDFSKDGLKLELCGTTVLDPGFKVVDHKSARMLPKTGCR